MFHFEPVSPQWWPAISTYIKCLYCEDSTGVIMVDDNDNMVAACVMDSWTDTSCNLHIMIKNPMVLRHGFLEEIFWFVFEEQGRSMVWGFTPADNGRALKFNKHVGMEEQYRMKDAYKEGVDYVVTRMLKEDCRWVENQEPPLAKQVA